MLIDWQEKWLTGDERIDLDHKDMVLTINNIHDAVEKGDSKENVLTILRSLVKLTYEHFSFEECLMTVTEYPRSDAHMDEHQNLHSIANILAYNIEVSDKEIVLDTIDFFEDWFIDHVENMDAELGRFLKDRQIAGCHSSHDSPSSFA